MSLLYCLKELCINIVMYSITIIYKSFLQTSYIKCNRSRVDILWLHIITQSLEGYSVGHINFGLLVQHISYCM